jgi:hypothetical protein
VALATPLQKSLNLMAAAMSMVLDGAHGGGRYSDASLGDPRR